MGKSPALETYDQIISSQERTESPFQKPQALESKPKPVICDYEKYFLKFEPPSHSRVAYDMGDTRNESELEHAQLTFDEALQKTSEGEVQDHAPSIRAFFAEAQPRARGIYQPRVQEIIESLQGSSVNPVDLTDEHGKLERHRPQDLSLIHI